MHAPGVVVGNRSGGAHDTGLSISGLPAGTYKLSIDGRAAGTVAGGTARSVIPLRITGSTVRVLIARQ